MEYSDDKTYCDGQNPAVDTENVTSVPDDADGVSAPFTDEEVSCAPKSDNNSVNPAAIGKSYRGGASDAHGANDKHADSFGNELIAVAVKSVAVALSVILMLTCILAVALPLSAMRVFNKLGMSERAVDFGERYISRELGDYEGMFEYVDNDGNKREGIADASHTDDRGNFDILAKTGTLTNDDFIEALYVCTKLSYDLAETYYASGESACGTYYAERVEKYTRMYLSLNNVAQINSAKSLQNISSMPSLALRPAVYSYGHDIRVMNYRARAWLGTTDVMAYNSNKNGDSVTSIAERSATFYGIDIKGDGRHSLMSNIDGYVDYIGAIGEYLDVEFLRAGVENNLSKKGKVNINGEWREVPVLSETYVKETYNGVLNGTEFSLFVSRTDGFTRYYNQIKRFKEFAQAAVDFMPDDGNNNKLDEQLHRLYWLQVMSSVARRLWYTEFLLYYNAEKYGQSSAAIRENNGALQELTLVRYGGYNRQIWEVYNILLKEYIAQYQS